MAIRKILIPRFDSLGDLILLQGLVRSAKEREPKTRLTLLVREGMLQLRPLFPPELEWLSTSINPYLERPGERAVELERVVASRDWDEIWFTGFSRTWLDIFLAHFLSHVRQIHLGDLPAPTPILARLLAQRDRSTPPAKIKVVEAAKEQHELTKLQAFLGAALGVEPGAVPYPVLHVPETAREEASAWLEDRQLRQKAFVACVPSGSENVSIKAWPAENYGRLVAWLEQEKGMPVLLIGHETEKGELQAVVQVAEKLGTKPRMWLGTGGDLEMLAGILLESCFYLGNDTGPMHLAAALSVPVAAVIGGGTWPRFLPWGKAVVAVRRMPCFGCAWDCCFGDAPCVRELPVETVQRMLDEFISEISAPFSLAELEAKTGEARLFEAGRYRAETDSLIQRAAAAYGTLQKTRSEQLESLERAYLESEADHAARLEVTQQQGLRIAQMDEEIRRLRRKR